VKIRVVRVLILNNKTKPIEIAKTVCRELKKEHDRSQKGFEEFLPKQKVFWVKDLPIPFLS